MKSCVHLPVLLLATLGLPLAAQAQRPSQPTHPAPKESAMTQHASGTFDVKVAPLTDPKTADEKTLDSGLGRMSIDKHFHGDLEASSLGQMLAVGTGAKGSSGGYVALERVTGKLNGRSGSFVLQHSGTMTRGEAHMTVTVVPDSGAGEMVGLAGKMTIDIKEGKHFYGFDYTLIEGR